MLLGLRASDYPADVVTDAAIVAIAESQEMDGRWAALKFSYARRSPRAISQLQRA